MDFLEVGNIFKINGRAKANKLKFFKFRGTYTKGFACVEIVSYTKFSSKGDKTTKRSSEAWAHSLKDTNTVKTQEQTSTDKARASIDQASTEVSTQTAKVTLS